MTDIFDSKQLTNIKKLFNELKPTNEFEFMFNNYSNNPLTISKFKNVLEYMSNSNNELIQSEVLDITYNYDKVSKNSYRISLKGLDFINKTLPQMYKRLNHVIFSLLLSNKMNNMDNKNIDTINKLKFSDKTINIDDFDIRIRVSDEIDLTSSDIKKLLPINDNERFNINYRFKNRASMILIKTKDIIVSLDATIVKMSNNINTLMEGIESYELELDVKKIGKVDDKIFDKIIDEIIKIKKILQQSDVLLSNTEKNKVIDEYKKIVYGDNKQIGIKGLYLMQPVSLEIQHVTDYLPNKYSVTDKADGERFLMLIMFNNIYLVSTTLDFKKIGSIKKAEYNNTIIDGEYIFFPEYQKYIYLAFDILFHKGNDVRNVTILKDRIKLLDDVLNNCLNIKLPYSDYEGEYRLDTILNHHSKNIDMYINDLTTVLKDKELNTIRRKYFIYVFGGSDNEIFAYSKLMWNKYTNNNKYKCPYLLDGLLYTGLDQKYTKNLKEIKYNTYKWKPPHTNSIDFYIQFEKNENNNIITLFDDSNDEKVSGKYYRICNLFVGRLINDNEQPVLFKKDEGLYIAHLFVQDDGEIYDIEGNIILDNTVVEFAYNDDIELDDKYRWIPLRTRFDKTESVRKFKKKYGNNEEIASRVWSSIRNRFTIDDINKLADNNIYDTHMKTLKSKIDRSVISAERRQNVYYQIITNLAKPQRYFHNWVKSNMIYLICSKKNTMNNDKPKALNVLDIGVGRGGDIMKFYHSRVNSLVGIDRDNYGINFATDGAISRYNQFKSKFPNFPKMYFIQGDAGALLNYDDQLKIIGNMDDKNKNLLTEYFGTKKDDKPKYKYDIINCQFMIHYLFENDNTWNNFTNNVNKYIADDGFLLITTFDGDTVAEKIKDSNYTVHYTNKTGEKKIFFDIIPKYKADYNNKKWMHNTGLAIDFHSALISEEGVYITEYLVNKDYIIDQLYKKCGLVLVETDMFDNLYNSHKDFFFNAAEYESNLDNKGFYMSVKRFYDHTDEENKASFELTKLNRYYIFRKINEVSKIEVKEKAKGGKKTSKKNKKN